MSENHTEGYENIQEAMRNGSASGAIGADFFGDETWYDTPPPEKVENVAMKIAELHQQTREEQ